METAIERTDPAAVVEGAGDGLPTTGLLSFYDRLRARVAKELGRRGGKLGAGAAEVLLLIPDVFMLLLRLAFDRDVPQKTRLLLGSALLYFVVPFDFLPEIMVGPTGLVDDLVLALAVLQHAFGRDLEPFAEKYWSGSEPLREVLADILDAAGSLLGYDVYERLRSWLGKHGVDLDAATEEAAEPA